MSTSRQKAGVVIHLNEAGEEKHSVVLRNVSNLLDEMGPDLEIELVVHGPGIFVALRDSPLSRSLSDLISRGVLVAACENTLRQKNISQDSLAEGVQTVPAGIAELVRRQQQGWAYLRP